MRAEDIKVGMWVRDPGGDVCKTSRQSEIVRGWHVEYPSGRLHTWPCEQLEPWTPRVGEWVTVRNEYGDVRQYHPKPFRVTDLSSMSHGSMVHGHEQGGRLRYGKANLYEPCLPPAPPTTHLRADGVEVPVKAAHEPPKWHHGERGYLLRADGEKLAHVSSIELDGVAWWVAETYEGGFGGTTASFVTLPEAVQHAESRFGLVGTWAASWPGEAVTITEADAIDYLDQADAADRRYRAHVAGANSTCPKCGGLAYLGLQEARCLAPKCERVEPEPEVRELWVGFRHEKRPGERGIRDALSAPWGPQCERWWQASGRGHAKNHPIREEAIRLWREAVARG